MSTAARTLKKIAITQSNYIPWKGYFDIINQVDEFVFLDDAQFTKRDWRNRNLIKTPHGLQWLTIPVVTKSLFEQPIDHTRIAERWADRHWNALQANYARARNFREIAPRIKALYEAVADESHLSRVNYRLTTGLCELLGIETKFSWSRDYPVEGKKTDRLVAICTAAHASHYLTGPAAAVYLEIDKFVAARIQVSYMDYAGYPEYPQLHGPFMHHVSILDLLFNVGLAAPNYLKSFRA
jgi:hypothetical protein